MFPIKGRLIMDSKHIMKILTQVLSTASFKIDKQ